MENNRQEHKQDEQSFEIVEQLFFYLRFWPYFLVLCISFILEDTLETQAGLSFYAFFYTLFISEAFFKKQQRY